jgi:hypothetical protein
LLSRHQGWCHRNGAILPVLPIVQLDSSGQS